MKNLFISELLLVSQTEKAAKRIQFDRNRTVILGKNHTGKSSVIKSILRTFGTEPLLHPNFKKANVISLVRFSVEEVNYEIVRDGDTYAIFDDSGNLINKSRSVTLELAPFLSEILDFRPLFQNKNNEFVIPPPAFLFLPYYIDQDESWNRSWSSLRKLQYIKDYRNQSIQYHSGIRPNEYYQMKKDIETYIQSLSEIDQEKRVLENVLKKFQEELSSVDFNFDIEDFKEEIKQLLVESEMLRKKEESLKNKLLDLYTTKAIIESQIQIVRHALHENKKDLIFASQELTASVDCPTCGAIYENTFVERFEFANDEEKSNDLLLELQRELTSLDSDITDENKTLTKTSAEYLRVQSILEQKKGDIQLKDVLDNMGKKQVKELFQDRKKELNLLLF